MNTLENRIKNADLIIFLDYKTSSQIKGIFKRWITNFNKYKKEVKGCKEKISFSFLLKTIQFNKNKRPQILNLLSKQNNNKILIFKNKNEINHWLEALKTNNK